jgi:hypothetical protein
MVDNRAGELAAEPAGRIGAGLSERSVLRLLVGDDGIAGEAVCLNEDGLTAR